MRALCIIDTHYQGHCQEIRSFSQFLPQIGDFQKNRILTPMDFEKKIKKFKTHKNLYTGRLWITDTYGF
jgi:hypothetical protein